ncbi:MAG: serine hydrolase [Alphaproteobacteria bacterium]|nr:serine hydrolase [Alphaproteobacteria bacterium]
MADDRLTRIDALFADWARDRQPGASLAVVSKGEVVLKKSYGLADLEHGVPLSSSSIFYICSITKQFCATALLMLEAEGKLSLEDEAQKHLPELPRFEQKLTIRHLLNNTSGLRDDLTLMLFAGIGFEQAISRDDLFDLVTHQRTLDFAPATRYRYSNSNFMLASVIVERVSGEDFRAFLSKRIFKPLGMTSTRLCDDNSELIPGVARPYSRDGGGAWHRNLALVELSGDGGILSSVDDMLIWHGNYRHNRLQPADLMQKLSTRGRMANGHAVTYALGLRTPEYRGRRVYMHGGGWPGYSHELVHFLDDDLGILLFTNRDDTRPTFLTRAIADIWLGLTPASPRSDAPPPERLAGRYFDHDEGYTMVLTAEGPRLVAEVVDYKFWLEQTSSDRFDTAIGPHPVSLRLLGPSDAKYPKIEATLDGGQVLIFEHPTPAQLAPEQLGTYAGTYSTPELPVAYIIEAIDDRLSLRLDLNFPKPGRQTLTPLGDDLFVVQLPFFYKPSTGTIKFLRGPGGVVDGLRMNLGRISNLRMTRRPG